MKPAAPRSKTLAAWLALLGGGIGLHRLYLRGLGDGGLWLHALAGGAGLAGIARLRALGLDDCPAALLVPWLGLSIAGACASAIHWSLMPDARWHERHGAAAGTPAVTRWAPILAAVLALALGAGALMATLAYAGQRAFECTAQDRTAYSTTRPMA